MSLGELTLAGVREAPSGMLDALGPLQGFWPKEKRKSLKAARRVIAEFKAELATGSGGV